MTQGSSTQNLQEMVENFSLFSDWEERYRYLIDLGRTLPEMDNALKTDENLVQGCTSRVWMVAGVKDGRFHFRADSDAHIVRGLIALLVVAYQDKPVAELTSIDVEGAFKKIGLDQNLSPNRRNGFFAMVERIKTLAETRA
ncbi:MAG TPA: SufE family protein [Alphaproteobacteria bacterium]|nr:SufE family protein [Micavibrio sp.]MBK9563200.1 SufE family protein [Micavibrio sp.]HQX26549.1 SufE family protein [Alphaproteobacteria bacterium]